MRGRVLGWASAAVLLAGAVTLTAGQGAAQNGEPYKLGTFSIDGRTTVGVVLRDSIVVDLAAANRDYETKNGSAVKTLAPIIYPGKSLNAAANYYGHAGETGTPEEQRKEAEARRKDRGAPYLFLKAMEGAVIGDADDILMPRGRERVDWECELAVVIGKKAKYVTAEQAKDYIFGYTIELDMSDRGGRPEKEPRFGGSDWFIGKSHDTFAPMGPWIVPKEFYRDPMNVGQKLTVNGKVMQDSRSTDMIHNISELIEYSTSILTMFPG